MFVPSNESFGETHEREKIIKKHRISKLSKKWQIQGLFLSLVGIKLLIRHFLNENSRTLRETSDTSLAHLKVSFDQNIK